ncbi:MAG: tetratricopeptide repeat protein, partial [Bryobacter sp.]|nr:tetratricopeptide repeat protein [Bryobacter sp.]
MMRGRALVSVLLFAGLCHGQTARELLDQVQQLRSTGRIDQAQPLLERALAEAIRGADRWAEAEARRGLGQAFNRKNKYAEGRAELDRAYSIFESLGDRVSVGRVDCDYAFLAWVEGDRAKETRFFRKALAEFTASGARAEQAVALVQLVPLTSDPGEKLKLAAEGHRLAREAGDRGTESRALARWGDTLFSQGKYAEAAVKLSEAVAVATENGLDRDAGFALSSLARVYRAHGMNEQSLRTHLRAFEFNQRVGDAVQTTQTLNSLSIAYGRVGDKQAELDYAQRALEMAKKSGTPRLILRQSVELGTIYRLRGDFRDAVKIYEEAIAAGGDPNEIPWRHLAYCYTELKDPRALETADRAVELGRKRYPEYLPETLRVRALIRKDAGRLDAAMEDIREGLRILERQRQGAIATDAMKRGFAEENQRLFALAVDVLFQLDRAGEALEVAESARGRAFVDLMATRNTPVKPKHSEQLAALRTLDREFRSPAAESPETSASPLPTRGPGRSGGANSEWAAFDPELRSFVSAEPYSLKQFAAAAA